MEYNGKTYRNQEDLVIDLRLKNRMTYDDIGKIIKKSRTHVGTILREANLSGHLLYPELEIEETFDVPDELIAASLNIKLSRVASARKRVRSKNPHSSRLDSRRRHLVRALFGKGYSPGPNFNSFIRGQIKDFSAKKRALIEDFYIDGQTQSLADDVNLDSDRVYRTSAKEELKDKLSLLNLKSLEEEGILRNGRGNHTESD